MNREKRAFKAYIAPANLEPSPEWIGAPNQVPKNAGPPAVEEEKKHNQRNVMVLNAALESSEAHAPMHFYNAQRRQYLENRNKAAQKRSEENDKFNSSLS